MDSSRVKTNARVLAAVLCLACLSARGEEFRYYVWTDSEGIVHASEEPPKGRDYQVRIIEDINSNVVPSEDFRPFGELPLSPAGEDVPAEGENL